MKKKRKVAKAAFLAVASFTLIHFVNRIIFYITSAGEKLFRDSGSFYRWRFGKGFYTKRGKGSPLLLIHDLDCTSSGYEWKEVKKELAKNHTVYTIDLPGCGRSDKPEIIYTAYFYVSLIRDFCLDIIKEKTAVAVTGRSAPSVLMAAYLNPDLFGRILLVNPEDPEAKCTVSNRERLLYKAAFGLPVIGTFLYYCSVSYLPIKKTFQRSYYANPRRIRNHSVLAYREAAHLQGSSSRFLALSIRSRYTSVNTVHALPFIHNNICILSDGRMDSEAICGKYKALLPAASVLRIKAAGRLPQMEKPDEFIKYTEMHLRES